MEEPRKQGPLNKHDQNSYEVTELKQHTQGLQQGPLHIYYGLQLSDSMGFLSVRMSKSLFLVSSLELCLFVLSNSKV